MVFMAKCEAEKCDNCLCNLERCKAECCKEFSLFVNPRKVIKRGSTFMLHNPTEDQKLYFYLHNQMVEDNKIIFTLRDFKKVKNRVTCFERCRYLDENNMCKHHNDGLQPNICAYPNKNNISDENKTIYITPNCVYKRD